MDTLRTWIAEQYDANLFEGCNSESDVRSVIEDLEDLKFDREELITAAWKFVKESFPKTTTYTVCREILSGNKAGKIDCEDFLNKEKAINEFFRLTSEANFSYDYDTRQWQHISNGSILESYDDIYDVRDDNFHIYLKKVE